MPSSLIAFLVVAVIVVLAAVAVFIGITMRKKKNLQLTAEVEEVTEK